jgi:hypothetical protein
MASAVFRPPEESTNSKFVISRSGVRILQPAPIFSRHLLNLVRFRPRQEPVSEHPFAAAAYLIAVPARKAFSAP